MLWSPLADETNPSSANASTAEPSEMRRIAKPPIGPRQPRGVPPRRESLCFGGGQSRRQCCLATVGGSATVRLDTTPIEGQEQNLQKARSVERGQSQLGRRLALGAKDGRRAI